MRDQNKLDGLSSNLLDEGCPRGLLRGNVLEVSSSLSRRHSPSLPFPRLALLSLALHSFSAHQLLLLLQV